MKKWQKKFKLKEIFKMSKDDKIQNDETLLTDENQVGETEEQQVALEENPTEQNLDSEIESLKEQVAELNDKMLRKAAEFDNFRRRKDKEFAELILVASERTITSILPVLDDFERTLKASEENENDTKALKEGILLVKEKLQKTLEEQGLKTIESLGKSFDHEKHDAMLQIEKEGVESGIVVEEYEKGYLLNDKVIRHSKVIVSK
ncbi:MAG: nucleotide exchange factor GrpE [Calditrichaeota bacterium]|nr:MAG: nucleotide exchange factor GrpE [Calditrichota bacterium]